MEWFKKLLAAAGLVMAVSVVPAGLTGCEDDAGDDFEEAVEDAGDNMEEAGEDAADSMEDAGEKAEDGVHDATH